MDRSENDRKPPRTTVEVPFDTLADEQEFYATCKALAMGYGAFTKVAILEKINREKKAGRFI